MEPVSVGVDRSVDEPKRGRPRLLAPAYEAEMTRMAGVTSTQGIHGRYRATLAAHALFDLDRPGWAPRDPAFAHFVKRNGDLKWSMLSELGRIPGASTVQAVARLVGEQHPPTRDAMTLIRRIRVGASSPPRA